MVDRVDYTNHRYHREALTKPERELIIGKGKARYVDVGDEDHRNDGDDLSNKFRVVTHFLFVVHGTKNEQCQAAKQVTQYRLVQIGECHNGYKRPDDNSPATNARNRVGVYLSIVVWQIHHAQLRCQPDHDGDYSQADHCRSRY